jgi:two-component system heavy metal sensor histidine kinase CusS
MTQRFSLTTRLTLFYTLASATVLLGLGWVTSLAMNQHFEDLDRSLLEDKIHLVQEVASKATSRKDFEDRLNDVLHSHEGLIVAVQASGKILYETAPLKIPVSGLNERPAGMVAAVVPAASRKA